MSANDHQFKRRFDTLRTETHQIIEHAHSPKNDVLSAEEKRKLRQESIAKLEVKLASYISMLQALDRQMEIKHWRDMAERMERYVALPSRSDMLINGTADHHSNDSE
ncbi:hypothetical protein D9756_002424 [Leucocoprinus leucothites]|uniref:Uncharacterized protein n=1 Tax=Leucocoprinus leucothites TaxID=201217 RepID=A0A8H5GBQ7_9AGAR|nr:hypothetical protein D9756_002424 [Leucoagaricus leucothites]